MRASSSWSEWPVGPVRVGVVLLVAVATLAVVVSYPGLLRELGDDAAANTALSYADREIAGGNGIVVDQEAVYAARSLIPQHASYHVAVGAGYVGQELTRDHVASYYRYFLMPRRPVENARWVVCYGCDTSQYGDETEVVWSGDEDISILRVGP